MAIESGDTRKRIFGVTGGVGVLAQRNPRPNRVRGEGECEICKAKANECSNGKTSMGEKQDRKCMVEAEAYHET